MKSWLRRVVPDLLLAACIGLLLTLALQRLDQHEADLIVAEVRWAADGGLTLDERLGAFTRSIHRTTLLYIPVLVTVAGLLVGLMCRNRRQAWLISILAVAPATLVGVGFFVDTPAPAAAYVAASLAIPILVATSVVAVRNRFRPVAAAIGV